MCSGDEASGDMYTSPVHLRGPGDHVLDVVGVSGAVDVRVVPILRLVLDVRSVDRDLASPGVVHTKWRGKGQMKETRASASGFWEQ